MIIKKIVIAAGVLLSLVSCDGSKVNSERTPSSRPDSSKNPAQSLDMPVACNKVVGAYSMGDMDANGIKVTTRAGGKNDIETPGLGNLVFDCIVVQTTVDARGTQIMTSAVAKPNTNLADIGAIAAAAGLTLLPKRDDMWYRVDGNTKLGITVSVRDNLEKDVFPDARLSIAIMRTSANE
jgi:hypothetical protein